MAKAITKKKWIKILAPRLFNSAFVGETTTLDPKTVVGKVVKVNLSTLINDMRKQNTELSLLIESIEGDKAKTKLIGLKLLPTSIKRMVRKGRTRLDQTVRAITKDEQVVTVKVILIPRNYIQGSVFSAIQHETKRFITKKISASTYDSFCEEIATEKLKRELKTRLSKLYPIKICDIKEFKLERFMKAMDLRKIKSDLEKEKRKPEKKAENTEEKEAEEKKAKPTEEKEVKKQEEKPSEEKKEEPPKQEKPIEKKPEEPKKEEAPVEEEKEEKQEEKKPEAEKEVNPEDKKE